MRFRLDKPKPHAEQTCETLELGRKEGRFGGSRASSLQDPGSRVPGVGLTELSLWAQRYG